MNPMHTEMPREPAPEGVQSCRRCGCWDWGACWHELLGACWWAEEDLCSHCAVSDWRLKELNRRALAGAVQFWLHGDVLNEIECVEVLEEAA
ncbi:MAG: hypothetical protein OXC08_20625 [Thiotrichales bacterium]|nr:hypothetical protein [Thiotrichales bacterium]